MHNLCTRLVRLVGVAHRWFWAATKCNLFVLFILSNLIYSMLLERRVFFCSFSDHPRSITLGEVALSLMGQTHPLNAPPEWNSNQTKAFFVRLILWLPMSWMTASSTPFFSSVFSPPVSLALLISFQRTHHCWPICLRCHFHRQILDFANVFRFTSGPSLLCRHTKWRGHS